MQNATTLVEGGRIDIMPIYTCPFCKGEVKNDARSFKKHRQPGGECEMRLAEKAEKKAKRKSPPENVT